MFELQNILQSGSMVDFVIIALIVLAIVSVLIVIFSGKLRRKNKELVR